MKKNYIVKILFAVLFVIVGLLACTASFEKDADNEHKHTTQYTCPMHPDVLKDTHGQCPVCGMNLVPKEYNKGSMVDTSISSLTKPVNARIIASIPTITAESGTRIFSIELNGTINYDTRNQNTLSSRVSGRIEKLNIKYNYQPIQKGELIMEIYSPDLASAQREFLYIVETADELMINKAKQRLELLGMRADEIKNILNKKEVMYRIPVYSDHDGYILDKTISYNNTSSALSPEVVPRDGMSDMNANGSTDPVSTVSAPSMNPSAVLLRQGQYISAGQPLFTIYSSKGVVAEFAIDQQTAAKVKQGQKLLLYTVNDRNNMFSASIGLIEPVYRNGQYFSIARVYLDNHNFRVGQLLTANMPVVFSGGWWLPKKAVWQTGNKSVVFKKEGDSFKPAEVKPGATINDMVQVRNDISDWAIASNAYYLVDSESFIPINANNK